MYKRKMIRLRVEGSEVWFEFFFGIFVLKFLDVYIDGIE